ncbi:MAG: hypothetical protein QXJ06_04825 [Candidatus Aenigmatarchaeota archaeon]
MPCYDNFNSRNPECQVCPKYRNCLEFYGDPTQDSRLPRGMHPVDERTGKAIERCYTRGQIPLGIKNWTN